MRAQVTLVQLAPTYPPIEALPLPDGKLGGGIKSLCRMVDISFASQLNRIKRQPDLAAALQYVTVNTTGGPKPIACLESYAIAIWAASIQTSRLSPASQEAVIILKQRAYAAIARAFSLPEVTDTTSRTTQTIPNPVQQPIATSHTTNPFDRITANLEDMIAGVRELKGDYSALEQRILILENTNLGRRSTPGTSMTPQMIGELFLQLRLLREIIGIPIEEAEKMLTAEFGVAHLSDVDSARWTELIQKVHQLFQQESEP